MDEKPMKHRMLCASRLVFYDSGHPVNLGLPCDCAKPAKWVEVLVPPAPAAQGKVEA